MANALIKLVLLPVIFSALWSPPLFSAQFSADIQRIKDRGKIVVARYHEDRFPFFFHSAGNLAGLDVKIAEEVARLLEVTVEYHLAPSFDEIVDVVAAGQADVGISELSITLARAQKVAYTQPYAILHKALLIDRVGATQRKRGDDPFLLCNHPDARIGALKGSSHLETAKELFPLAEILPYASFLDAVAACLAGELLAVVSDDRQITHLLREDPAIVLKLRAMILKDQVDPIGIITHADNTHLLSWLNLYLQTRKISYTTDSLLKLYSPPEEH